MRDSFTIYPRPLPAASGLAIVGTYTFNIFMPSFAAGQLRLSASTGRPVSLAWYVVFGASISAVSLLLIKDPINAQLD